MKYTRQENKNDSNRIEYRLTTLPTRIEYQGTGEFQELDIYLISGSESRPIQNRVNLESINIISPDGETFEVKISGNNWADNKDALENTWEINGAEETFSYSGSEPREIPLSIKASGTILIDIS